MRISFSLLEMRNNWYYVVIVPTGPYLYIKHDEVERGGLSPLKGPIRRRYRQNQSGNLF